jgi:hypothetical protein
MTIDSVIAFLIQTAGTPIGAGVLTALVIGTLKSTPRLLRGLGTGLYRAPERILMGALNAIDRRASAKGGGLL